MKTLHPLAQELNGILEIKHPQIFSLLSQKGKAAYFPRLGILSQAADADGKAINATIGIALEDDRTPVSLKTIAAAIALDPKDVFPYASSYGKQPLRQLWQDEIRRKNPTVGSAVLSMPVVNAGLTHSLSVAGFLFLDPGDLMIIPFPYWDNYELIFEEAYGAVLRPFPIFEESAQGKPFDATQGKRFNVDGLKAELSKKPFDSAQGKPFDSAQGSKQILFLNFPNNPTGYTPLKTEVDGIVAAILASAEQGNQVVVFLDDAYFGLIYDDAVYPESLFGVLANLHQNVLAVKIDGATKEEFAWGLRVGFLTYGSKGLTPEGAKALEAKTAGVVRGSVSNCSHLAQTLILNALKTPGYEQEKQAKFALLQTRFSHAKEALADPKYAEYFSMLPCNSGYFLCVELKGNLMAEAVRQKLLADYSTGIIAMDRLIRVAFSSVPTKDLPALFENIYLACKDLS